MHRLFEATDQDALVRDHAASIRGIATRGELGASRELIASLPALEIISVYGVGYDAVCIEACRERDIRVTNTPDVLTEDVADFGVSMMLAQARGIVGGENWVRGGDWIKKGLYPLQRRVHGRRAGILGLGRIGYEVGRRLAGFKMSISYSDIRKKDEAEDWAFVPNPVDLARCSDVLFVTLSASVETRHIVNREVIEAVGPEGMIVNISRASNVDEEALIEALSTGRLGSAALDVFEGEPNIDERFHDLPNVLLQPHQASATVETRKAMGRLLCDNLKAYFEGQELLTPVL